MRNKPTIYIGQTKNPSLNIDWSKLKRHQSLKPDIYDLIDVYYFDHQWNKQIRIELWKERCGGWFLRNVCGVKDDIQEGECITLHWNKI